MMNDFNVEYNVKWCEVLSHVSSLCSRFLSKSFLRSHHKAKRKRETKIELETLLNADNKAIKNDNIETNQMLSELNFHKLPWIFRFYGRTLNCRFWPWICYLLILVEIDWIPFEYWNSWILEVIRENINTNDNNNSNVSIRL